MREIQSCGRTFLAFEQLARASGLRHLFSTRAGDGSAGNLSLSGKRDLEAALEERRVMSRALDVAAQDWVVGGLVHGARVSEVAEAERGRGAESPSQVIPESDGLVTVARGLPLFVAVADCAAVLLYAAGEPPGMAVVHAGWRGLRAGVLAQAVSQLARVTGRPAATFRAGISPAIGLQHFEVGDEVAEPAPASRRLRLEGRWHVDLSGWAHDQLHHAGLPLGQIEVSGLDTAERADLFFSHRRDGEGAGRMGLLAVLPPAPAAPQAPRG